MSMARRLDCNAVCCGHTHAAIARTEQPIPYFNSGCWTELPCTYLSVQDGIVRLHEYRPEKAAKKASAPAPSMVTAVS